MPLCLRTYICALLPHSLCRLGAAPITYSALCLSGLLHAVCNASLWIFNKIPNSNLILEPHTKYHIVPPIILVAPLIRSDGKAKTQFLSIIFLNSRFDTSEEIAFVQLLDCFIGTTRHTHEQPRTTTASNQGGSMESQFYTSLCLVISSPP